RARRLAVWGPCRHRDRRLRQHLVPRHANTRQGTALNRANVDRARLRPSLVGWHALSTAKGVRAYPTHALHVVQGVPPNREREINLGAGFSVDRARLRPSLVGWHA